MSETVIVACVGSTMSIHNSHRPTIKRKSHLYTTSLVTKNSPDDDLFSLNFTLDPI